MDRESLYREAIEDDIRLMERWVQTSLTGGWSTHLVEPLRKRITELYALLGRASMAQRS